MVVNLSALLFELLKDVVMPLGYNEDALIGVMVNSVPHDLYEALRKKFGEHIFTDDDPYLGIVFDPYREIVELKNEFRSIDLRQDALEDRIDKIESWKK
jgi:hypothetical protein